jgi:hypothetical protein
MEIFFTLALDCLMIFNFELLDLRPGSGCGGSGTLIKTTTGTGTWYWVSHFKNVETGATLL